MRPSKALDQFYTPASTADQCVALTLSTLPSLGYSDVTFLEPSAGTGAFLDALSRAGVEPSAAVAVDIAPKDSRATKADYLEDDLSDLGFGLSGDVVVIGNPPFGKKASLVLSFIKRSLAYSDTIAFIVPVTMRRHLTQRKLPDHLRLVVDADIDSTFLHDGLPYSVNSCFQVWTTRRGMPDIRSRMRVPTSHPDFRMELHNCTPETAKHLTDDWHFAVLRQGWGNFEILESGTELNPRRQWMMFWPNSVETDDRLRSLDYEALADGNTSVRGFGKSDLVGEYLRRYPERAVVERDLFSL